jgi:hypothetical protein
MSKNHVMWSEKREKEKRICFPVFDLTLLDVNVKVAQSENSNTIKAKDRKRPFDA